MDRIVLPEASVIPMDEIADQIVGLRIAFVNVFGIGHANGSWTLVDAGLPFSAAMIARWAEKHFHRPPGAIVLTHGHFDHVSAARELSERWKAPIFAHPVEFPYLTGKLEYPAPDFRVGGGVMSALSPLYPRGPVDLGDRLFALKEEEGAADDILPGWRVIHTPGHTPGHISLFRRADRVLVAGDAICTTKPESFFEAALAQRAELHGPPAYFTQDWNAAAVSVEKLVRLDPWVVAAGHGKPLGNMNIADRLRMLAGQMAAHGKAA
jgi:glyoxylase-like metal-dependent hydrolase (beta-lactamase superfamily II)